MNKDNTEDQLKNTFTNVNDWLKFAEAKNAAIIAADAAAAFGAITILAAYSANLKLWFYFYLHIFVFFVMLSAVTALISVIPRTIILLSNTKEKIDDDNDNLLFFGHIAKYTPPAYLATIYKRCEKPIGKSTKLELNYAQQIVMNSQITLRKYEFFRLSAWFAITAIITPIGGIILFAVANKKYERWLAWWQIIRKFRKNLSSKK